MSDLQTIIAAVAGLQALGVFAAIGKAWAWMLRTERRLMRMEAALGLLHPESKS